VSQDSFLLLYGDILMDFQVIDSVVQMSKIEKNIIACKKVKDPTNFGVISCNSDGYVKKIIEKPKNTSYGNLINAGIYLFTSDIFTAISQTQKSPRGEYELTDTIENLLQNGHKLRALDISNYYWNDIGRPWDILHANKYYLDRQRKDIQGTIEEGVYIKGSVVVGVGTVVKSWTYIEGPVYIGENCIIGPNAFIRPFSSLGNNVRIGNSSEIKNSVVLSHTHISHLSYVGDSIIGENVNFGAGTIISNVRLDKGEISMNIKENLVNTGLNKLGAVIGDNVQLGIQSMIMVGKKIGTNSRIGPGTLVNKDIPANTTYYVKWKCVNEKTSSR
jgi:UDP-N-acetylglucosamine diphosphorylase/glucosamine-1-phosphate N-acetyltransferase